MAGKTGKATANRQRRLVGSRKDAGVEESVADGQERGRLRSHSAGRQKTIGRPAVGEWRDRTNAVGGWLETRAGAVGSWSLHELIGMLNPLRPVKCAIALVVAGVTLAARLWALVYRALAYMACDPRRGVFGATKHPSLVRRGVYAAFVAAVSLKCLSQGRSLAYVAWISSIAVIGGVLGERRASRRVNVKCEVVQSDDGRPEDALR